MQTQNQETFPEGHQFRRTDYNKENLQLNCLQNSLQIALPTFRRRYREQAIQSNIYEAILFYGEPIPAGQRGHGSLHLLVSPYAAE